MGRSLRQIATTEQLGADRTAMKCELDTGEGKAEVPARQIRL